MKAVYTLIEAVLVIAAVLVLFLSEARTGPMRWVLGITYTITMGRFLFNNRQFYRMTPSQVHANIGGLGRFNLLNLTAWVLGGIALTVSNS